MKVVDEKIIDKIRKVLALTGSVFQEEAQAAMLKAQKLLALHGLSMSEIDCKDQVQEKVVADSCVYEKNRVSWYEKRLGSIIGENFRCFSYNHVGQGIRFVGLREDVEIAAEVFLYAHRTMLYFAEEFVKNYRLRVSRIKGLKNDYFVGFISGLEDKFKEQVASNNYALVLVKDSLVVKAFNDLDLYDLKTRFVTSDSVVAKETGYRDGRSFDEKRKMIR
ncbi:DUF2786 domain-containing protein [Desulfocucumis palustris]|uniref:DUF2786 domain-containing protein n=1 Tax=Desulfocucumis palustris TaxID=1898651 RepID=UPI001E41B547|nr:DUF2786 domain-containing protein [Desulfocucumis palustris]